MKRFDPMPSFKHDEDCAVKFDRKFLITAIVGLGIAVPASKPAGTTSLVTNIG